MNKKLYNLINFHIFNIFNKDNMSKILNKINSIYFLGYIVSYKLYPKIIKLPIISLT